MEAFGDHLGADDDVDFICFEFGEGVTECIFTAHGVSIDACDACFWEDFVDDGFYFFCSESLHADGFVPAFWAFSRGDGLVAAHVAYEAFITFVVGEWDGTVLALADVTAGWALEGTGESAAVKE